MNPAYSPLLELHGIELDYPKAVLQEAERWAAAPEIDDARLKDWTDRPFITIDNEDSRDLDQAMLLTKRGDGFVLYYALADAAHYVRPGSALFDEALKRGASFYLPGFSVPMLPRVLSEGVVSLNEGVQRRALVVAIELNAAGTVQDTRLIRARIQSRQKLTYAGVQRYYDNPKQSPLRGQDFSETLDLLRVVGQLRIRDAIARHVVRYRRGPRLDVERYNEQISILCNVEGAQLLAKTTDSALVQGVFRVHPAPPPTRLAALEALIDALIEIHALDAVHWRWRQSEQPLADYLEDLPAGPVRQAIERQAMLTNVRSVFAADVDAHHGVGAAAYARLSSPMREIVGIYTHKELLELLAGSGRPVSEDQALRQAVIRAGNRSKEIQKKLERSTHKMRLDELFQTNKGPFYGSILGVRASRLYVALDKPAVEVKVYLNRLDGAYTLNREGSALETEGQALLAPGHRVRLDRPELDSSSQRWAFRLQRQEN